MMEDAFLYLEEETRWAVRDTHPARRRRRALGRATSRAGRHRLTQTRPLYEREPVPYGKIPSTRRKSGVVCAQTLYEGEHERYGSLPHVQGDPDCPWHESEHVRYGSLLCLQGDPDCRYVMGHHSVESGKTRTVRATRVNLCVMSHSWCSPGSPTVRATKVNLCVMGHALWSAGRFGLSVAQR
ncbi:hypothetical protein NDU88_012569 [Pleurodeles waltl]|uniref:Uncharacterized protein n=1 Tax=Pleurodeles waltl TaxID=8319 RepID=A0AAV7R4W1_PLEWA|nr:hypothetical protein NDU88_012569 [Pleurodeles waltl]